MEKTDELYELKGRVNAALVYIKSVSYPEKNIIVAMLEGDADGLPVHQEQ